MIVNVLSCDDCIVIMSKNVLIRKRIPDYIGVKYDDACNLLSHSSAKCVHLSVYT